MAEPADVAVLTDPADDPAQQTLREAMTREGWRVAPPGQHRGARCAVVVWSQQSVSSQALADAARPFLDRERILQIIWEPRDWNFGMPNAINPPQPFTNFENCIVQAFILDSRARNIDNFGFQFPDCEKILRQVARLAGLPRPRDAWNAHITFNKNWSKQVRIAEFAPDGVTLIRKKEIGGQYDSGRYSYSDAESLETAMGRHWRVLDTASDGVLGQIAIDAPECYVDLPKRGPFPWNRTRTAVRRPRHVPVEVDRETAKDVEEPPSEPARPGPEAEEHTPDTRPEIFISYARADQDVVRRIVTLLNWEDWRVWWDPAIQLGEDFRPVIREHIDAAVVVIVLWSASSRASAWVEWETDRGRKANKLVELTLGDGPEMVNEGSEGQLIIPCDPFDPRVRDAILERVSRKSGLRRWRDGWNAELHLYGWQNRPPPRPVIGWEYVDPGTPTARLVRRERFVDTPSISYGTTIGHAWVFGYENTKVPVGVVWITQAQHHVDVPQPNPARERQLLSKEGLSARVNEFRVHPAVSEYISGFMSPADLLGMFDVPVLGESKPGEH